MIWEYFWTCKFPRLGLSLYSYKCGLFGLNALETQKHSNLSTKDTKWSSWYKKMIKFKYCWLSGLCLAFMTFVGLFYFSCNLRHLWRLMVCFKVTSEQYNLKNSHQTKILKIDHCDVVRPYQHGVRLGEAVLGILGARARASLQSGYILIQSKSWDIYKSYFWDNFESYI